MKAVILLSLLGLVFAHKEKNKKPHIIYIVADDLGWDDVSWHNSAMITPNLQKLAEGGVILDNLYVHAVCSPTRSSLMTGFFASNIGSQHLVYHADQPHGLPTYLTTLPDKVKDQGYTTYGIGKWHLGFCNDSYIPTSRGFDHFYGFYTGAVDYNAHNTSEKGPYGTGIYKGYDFRDDGEREEGDGIDGVFSSILFNKRLEEIVKEHDDDEPMFMYLAFQLPHSPVVVPDKYAAMYRDRVKSEERAVYSGQVTFMDEIVGNLRTYLEEADMWDDSLILFHSDNGGDVKSSASNFPYRGTKGTYFEGGIKGTALAYGKGVEKIGYVNREMMHAVDIFPTLVSVAGGTIDYSIDGKNVWTSIAQGAPSPRTGFIITIDEDIPATSMTAAIRQDEWKYIEGYPALRFVAKLLSWYATPYDSKVPGPTIPESTDTTRWLYNLKDDPLEINNLAESEPDIVNKLSLLLDQARVNAWTDYPPSTADCDPAKTDGWWSSGWCEL